MKRAAMMAAAVAVAVALTGCEPAMTITANYDKSSGGYLACGQETRIIGKVTPATATKKVVLQMTKGGKWVDVKGWGSYETAFMDDPTLRTGNVSQTSGAYSIHYIVDWLSSTRHLRVRSAGGAVSPGFYAKSEGIEGYCGA